MLNYKSYHTDLIATLTTSLVFVVLFCFLSVPQAAAASPCPNLTSLSEEDLMKIVPTGDYNCIESLAQKLGPTATNSTVQNLLSTMANNPDGWARRNATRIIGRFAGFPSGSSTQRLVTVTMGAQVKEALLRRLQVDSDGNVLNDAIWILDSYFLPYYTMQPALQILTAKTNMDASVRFRAMGAIRRLINEKPGIISQQDRSFLLQSLQSDDFWVKSEAAYTIEILRDDQMDGAAKSQMKSALQTAYTSETVYTPKVYMARAIDRLNGNKALFTSLKMTFEQTHLNNTVTRGKYTVKSGLPTSDLQKLLTLLENKDKAFTKIMGSVFSTPVATDKNATMTLVVLPTRALYKDYMGLFIGAGANSGGIYLQDRGILYTFQRTPAESSYTLEELVQHEFGHYLSHRFIFYGNYGSPGYFDQPKTWADEGTSEYFAGMVFDASGNYTTPLRSKVVARLCSKPFRNLQSVLEHRGDSSEVFDYDNGWSFVYYLLTKRKDVAMKVYTSYRNNNYTLANFAFIAGVSSVASLESEWHATMRSWCATVPTTKPTSFPVPTAVSSSDTTFTVTLGLHGLGNGGDNINRSAQGNMSPALPQRHVNVEVYDASNKLLMTKDSTVTYNSASGMFEGSINMGKSLQSGAYTVKVKVEKYLRAQVPGIPIIVAGKTNTIPTVYLVGGDVNNDNSLSILDFNILMDCYSDLLPPINCAAGRTQLADISDDGKVNQVDYNFFIRELRLN